MNNSQTADCAKGFPQWWETAKPLYDGDSQLCALRAWQYQQEIINTLLDGIRIIRCTEDDYDTEQEVLGKIYDMCDGLSITILDSDV